MARCYRQGPDRRTNARSSLAWAMVRHVKSNAIVLCKDEMLIGVGAGQMSRVDSVEISMKKQVNELLRFSLASDAFFPFDDGVRMAKGVVRLFNPVVLNATRKSLTPVTSWVLRWSSLDVGISNTNMSVRLFERSVK